MWPKSLTPNKDGILSRTLKKHINRGVQHLVFGKSLVRTAGAQFASSGEIREILNSQNTGIPLDGKDARLSEEMSFANIIVNGIVGTGKSTVYARPLILDKGQSDAVLIVNDMSGDLYRDTSGYMKSQGYRIIVLNPNDLKNSNRYNPFLNFEKPSDILRFAELFSKVQGDGQDAFWSSGGERYIRLILKCLHRFDSDAFNTPHNLYHLLQNFGDDGEDLEEFIDACAEDDIFIKNEWKALTSGAEETITSFLTNALVALKILSEPHVCALTATSDIDLSDLRKQKTIIYVITPPEDQDIYRPLVSMFFLSFIHICMRHLPTSDDLPVYFVYDEFGNSYLPGFETLITNARKYKISFLLLMQGQQQLVTKYGKDNVSVIMSGIATHICFGAAEATTAEYYAKKIGKNKTIYRSEERDTHIEQLTETDLLSESDIRELPDDKVLVLCRNYPAFLLDVHPSYNNTRYKMMMSHKPAPIASRVKDKLVFIPL